MKIWIYTRTPTLCLFSECLGPPPNTLTHTHTCKIEHYRRQTTDLIIRNSSQTFTSSVWFVWHVGGHAAETNSSGPTGKLSRVQCGVNLHLRTRTHIYLVHTRHGRTQQSGHNALLFLFTSKTAFAPPVFTMWSSTKLEPRYTVQVPIKHRDRAAKLKEPKKATTAFWWGFFPLWLIHTGFWRDKIRNATNVLIWIAFFSPWHRHSS